MKHKLFLGKGPKEREWYIGIDEVNAASNIHVTDDEEGKGIFQGYGGSVLKFEMEDGTIVEVKGPWHTNAVAFFNDTGMLITDLHLTRIIIKDGSKVIYEEEKPVLGPFMRGERIVQQLANLLKKPLYLKVESEGGGSMHTAYPDKRPHVMGMRGRNDKAWPGDING